jgi:hypothetical protein
VVVALLVSVVALAAAVLVAGLIAAEHLEPQIRAVVGVVLATHFQRHLAVLVLLSSPQQDRRLQLQVLP